MFAARASGKSHKPIVRDDLIGILLELIQLGHPDDAVRTLQRFAELAQTYWANKELAEAMLAGLPDDFLRNRAVSEIYARVLSRARKVDELLGLYHWWSSVPTGLPTGVALYSAWALTLRQQAKQAMCLLETLEAQVLEEDEGTYLRFKAEALAGLGAEGWQARFAQARRHLSAGALGRCLLEEGNLHYRYAQVAEARSLWAEALAYLQDDPYYSAWLRHSLGITVLAQDPREAEVHLLLAEQLSHRRPARAFQARALCGLGAVRRRLREWDRAIFSYEAALKLAQDLDDRQEALWGIGFTLRLSGRPAEAIPYFLQAHAVASSNALFIEIAAAKLMLGSQSGAEVALGQAEIIDLRDRVKVALIRAQIACLRGDSSLARSELASFDLSSAWVLEEGGCFPELFALFSIGKASSKPGCTRVQVSAGGILRVKVNGREILLKPNSRAAELLVLLLEAEGEETLDRLVEALFPQMEPTPKARARARQAIWAQVQKLRHLLGWEDSVLVGGGVYRLDPTADWQYQIGNKPFLEGIYSPWVIEKREMLA
ncbi:MAG: tetratricopeptide repeat protein [Thermaceae bacterium]|nr:tetratricopeptide repeat protein [Thermaceae bacterium]